MHLQRFLKALASVAMCAGVSTVRAQSVVPVRELSAPDATASGTFGSVFGVRPLSGGRILVNDGERRQLIALDAKLTNRVVVLDSVSPGGQSYGPRATPLIPYLADSSLFLDGTSLSLLVIGPAGNVVRVMSAPKPSDLRFMASSSSGVDGRGNLVYRGQPIMMRPAPVDPKKPVQGAPQQAPDSAPIVRANFETRTVDTIGRVKIAGGTRVSLTQQDGRAVSRMTINPLNTLDEWAVLSDGSVAFIRGHDYHIDWVSPTGQTFSSAKLPFDWKRLTDDDKQKLIDSSRTAREKMAAEAKAGTLDPSGKAAAIGAAMGGGPPPPPMGVAIKLSAPDGMAAPMSFSSVVEYVPLNEIADYWPPIRSGAARADLDGNVWILPTTSAQSVAGELVYDVVNSRGILFQRVRVPSGRSIAGFGHKGVVYLMFRDGTRGWLVERRTIVNNTRAED